MKKRILSVLLVVSMLLTLVPSAFADGLSEGTVATIGEAEFTSLQDAIDETAKEAGTYEIKLLPGVIEENVTIVQKEGVYLTITGAEEGTTLKGMIAVDGQSAQIANQSVTIDGVDIEATGEYCIFIPSGGSRYSRNLTVKNCDFTGEGAVGIKQSTGGCIDWLIQKCSADETMHSLIQVVNVTGLVIDGCTVRSKNGINLNSSTDVEVKNSTVEVSGYAVRAGASSGGGSGAVTLTENTLKTDNSEGDAVIVLRGVASTEVDLDMSENIVSGDTHISGTVEETNITADNNYWDGEEDPIVSGAAVDVGSYYVDEELTEAVGDPAVVLAQIGNKFYKTIQEAIDEADDDTIVILKSEVLTQESLIPAGKKVTIDLNGKVISGVSTVAASSAVITNNGELTIMDSSEEQTGKITSQAENPDTEWEAGFPAYANNTIKNCGILTVESGTIENTTEGGACYAIDNNSTASNAIVIINGGVISHTTKVAIRQFANSATFENSVTINNGTVVGGSRAVWMQLPGSSASSEKKASLKVTDGVLTSKDETYNLAVYVYSYGDSGANTKIDISGGEFNGNVALYGTTSTMPEKAVSVTGGTFNGAYGVFSYDGTTNEAAVNAISITGGTFESDYCAPYAADEGYEFFKNAEGTYGLIKATPEEIEDKATVTFNVTPADAVVKVEKDGVEFGGIDNVYELLGGTYNYTVSKDGYYTVSGDFTVAGEDQPVNVTLTKIAYYTITYTDGVEDAEIFADQTFTVVENTATPAFEGTIAREGYTFKGWTPAVAATVTADATYVAVFEKIPEEPKDPIVPEEPEEPVFEDVSADAYYADAVVWAAKNEVTTGVSEGVFAPEVMCTRAQVVTFLWRAAGSPKASADTEVFFADIKEGSYYYDAVVWAVENGITNGISATEFAPEAVCTRAQVVTFLWRAAGELKAEGEMSFDDVAEGTYYYDAVLWAAENKITNGVSATEFAPETDCTRAQAITLIFRAV